MKNLSLLIIQLLLAINIFAQTTVNGLYYTLTPTDSVIPSSQLSNSNLAGISIRCTWNYLEPSDGVLDTTRLNQNIAAAKAAGKKIMLRVFPGNKTPAWVYAAGVPAIRYPDIMTPGDTIKIPVPWNSIYIAKWTSFIQRMGNAYGADTSIVLVHMTGANSASGEFGLAQRASLSASTAQYFDGTGNLVATGQITNLWLNNAGYTLNSIRYAWATFSNAWVNAFPQAKKFAYSIVSDVLLNDNIAGEVDSIVADAYTLYPQKLSLQFNGFQDSYSTSNKFNKKMYQIIRAYSSSITTGFQSGKDHGMCNNNQFTGDLGPAVAVGIYAFGAEYFELYGGEINKYPLVLQETNDFLLGINTVGSGTAGPLLCPFDSLPPSAAITSPLNNSTVSGTIPVSADVFDLVLPYGVQFQLNNINNGSEIVVSYPADTLNTFNSTLNTTTLADGVYSLCAIARDVSGNMDTACINITVDNTTGIIELSQGYGIQFYPNPASSLITIEFTLPQQKDVLLSVYDIAGNQIATLIDEKKSAGTNTAVFETKYLPAGTYFIKLLTPDYSQTQKIIITK